MERALAPLPLVFVLCLLDIFADTFVFYHSSATVLVCVLDYRYLRRVSPLPVGMGSGAVSFAKNVDRIALLLTGASCPLGGNAHAGNLRVVELSSLREVSFRMVCDGAKHQLDSSFDDAWHIAGVSLLRRSSGATTSHPGYCLRHLGIDRHG